MFTDTAKLFAALPFVDGHKSSQRWYIHKDVSDIVDCVGSGEPEHDIPERVYFAVNDTSGRVYPVEVTKLLCAACKHL